MREDSRRSDRITSANRPLGPKDIKLIKKFGNVLDPNVAKEMNPNPPMYKDYRTTKRGTTTSEKESMCINAISDLARSSQPLALFDMSETLPPFDTDLVFEPPNILKNEGEEYIIDKIFSPNNNDEINIIINNLSPGLLTINQDIKNDIDDNDITKNPIYFVIVSPTPHVMLLILHEGNLYTVGYGYYDASAKSGKLHTFDILKGAIYTADFLTPDERQQCKIIWIGYLTSDILTNLDNEFKKTTSIFYNKGKIDNNNIVTLSNECVLVSSSSKYSELASVSPSYFNLNNCLMWMKHIININLRCGSINNPTNCKEITMEEFETFKTLYKSNSPKLKDYIRSITDRLARWLGGKKTKAKRKKRKCKTNKRKLVTY
jgi:hypothetical protein